MNQETDKQPVSVTRLVIFDLNTRSAERDGLCISVEDCIGIKVTLVASGEISSIFSVYILYLHRR